MNSNADQEEPSAMLTSGERLKVVAIAGGFALVLAFLFYLSWRFDYYSLFIQQIEEAFRGGKIDSLRWLIVLTLFYAVGLPVGVAASLIAIVHGLRGKSTRLTRWILRESTHAGAMERHSRQVDAARQRGKISSIGQKALKTSLPPAIGWAIFALFLIAMVVILIVASNRDG